LSRPFSIGLLGTAVLGFVAALTTSCKAPEAGVPAASAAVRESPPPRLTTEESALLARLEQLRREHRELEALDLARRHLAARPGTPRLHYAIGVLLGSLEDHRAAIREFEIELAADPGQFESHRGIGVAATLVGEQELAVAHLRICAAMRPDDVDVSFQLGRNLSSLGRFAEAEPWLASAAERRGAADAWAELGLLHRRAGRQEAAAAAFRRALGSDPGHAPSLLNLGQIMVRSSERELGNELLARHRERARIADLVDHFERSSRLAGATAANFAALADAQLNSGDREAALTAYRRALELDGDFPPAAMGLAALLLESGEVAQASRWAVVALLAAPSEQRAHYLLGRVRLAKGQIEDAERSFADSRRRGAWNREAWLQVALAYERAGASGRADSALLEAARFGSSIEVELARARTLLLRGLSVPAAQTLRTALGREPDSAEGWMLLGIAANLSGEEAEAGEAWGRAVELQRADLILPGGARRIASRYSDLPGAEGALEGYLRLAAGGGEPKSGATF